MMICKLYVLGDLTAENLNYAKQRFKAHFSFTSGLLNEEIIRVYLRG